MERDEEGVIAKKRRVDSGVSGDIPNHEGEEASSSSKVVETQSPKAKVAVDGEAIYRLYFKGLESDEWGPAAYGVAICDQTDKLLFEFKEHLSEDWMGNKAVEIRALLRGLSESLDLGIKNIVIYCAENEIYQNITKIKGRCSFKKRTRGITYNQKEKRDFKELMEEVKRLRKKFASSEVTKVVTFKDIKFADELARDARAAQRSSTPDGDYDSDPGWANGCGCDHWCDSPPTVHPADNYNYDYL